MAGVHEGRRSSVDGLWMWWTESHSPDCKPEHPRQDFFLHGQSINQSTTFIPMHPPSCSNTLLLQVGSKCGFTNNAWNRNCQVPGSVVGEGLPFTSWLIKVVGVMPSKVSIVTKKLRRRGKENCGEVNWRRLGPIDMDRVSGRRRRSGKEERIQRHD